MAPTPTPPEAARPERTTPARPATPTPRPFPWWMLAAVGVLGGAVALGQRTGARDDEAPSEAREIGIPSSAASRPEALEVRVLETHPHDRTAFTQGLVWHEGALLESTGLYGESTLRRVALESGEVLARRDLEPRLFAEGLARVDDRLYQLTWQEHELRVWTLDGFEPVETVEYRGEGWGLCHDGTHLVMSDGSSRLTFRDPRDFHVVRTVRVREAGAAVDQLNELECVDGMVWANVWQTDRILRIDPRDGRVTGVVDAAGLLSAAERRTADVLNGIAWIPERHRFVITGKHWPRLFEVEFVPRGTAPPAPSEAR